MTTFTHYSFSEESAFSGYEELVRAGYARFPEFAETRIRRTRKLLSSRNPFLARARTIAILATASDGHPTGHVCVVRDPGAPAVFLGFCEFSDDQDASAALLAEASVVARAEGERRPTIAPVDLSPWISFRACVAGDAPPFPSEPYSPLRYSDIFVRAGFDVVQRNESRLLPVSSSGFDAFLEAHDMLLRNGFVFVPFAEALRTRPGDLHALFVRAFSSAPSFAPLPLDEFLYMSQGGDFGDGGRYSVVVIDPDGACVGALIVFSQTTTVSQRLIFKTIAVDPARVGQGLAKALFFKVHRDVGIPNGEYIFSTMRTDNDAVFDLTSGHGAATIVRQYATYRKMP